ncbi:hypothetical protein TNCV_2499111 [Trichonephila clavipes]|nr:hypothetical protein TNCV_2499111 [Trichonephila clavipes]
MPANDPPRHKMPLNPVQNRSCASRKGELHSYLESKQEEGRTTKKMLLSHWHRIITRQSVKSEANFQENAKAVADSALPRVHQQEGLLHFTPS